MFIWLAKIRLMNMQGLGAITTALLLSSLFLARTATAVSCASATGEQAVSVCQQELSQNPNDANVRLKLADTLIGLARFREAVEVLKRGVILQPGNSDFRQRLSAAESDLAEGEWIDKRAQARNTGSAGSQTAADELLCLKLRGEAAIEACDAVLAKAPGNRAVLVAKADALTGLGRFQDAVVEYKRVLNFYPQDADVAKKLLAVESRAAAKVSDSGRRSAASAIPDDTRALVASAAANAAPQVTVARTTNPAPLQRDDARRPATTRQYSNAPMSPGVTF
jgi:predicted Zn-dependent protease